MKKKYKKPQILFESMRLSTAIAGTCEYILLPDGTFVPEDNKDEGWSFIAEDTCSGGSFEEFCYHYPNDVDVVLLHNYS